ncbi:hypothetical protein MSUIS_05910 [Mycoplasma suis KI3806]|uniref:Uncharacterized protein n=1 Tax=Mycoplasma suis (strain KI_3806) TaxID=708248 RepID=F0V203_MYCS3|nr:hypothetical protein [Mycoplasma suis]CBZ40684.1 hypothetical protein MSUIS_05910 [Mycoplasma suis KI3806]
MEEKDSSGKEDNISKFSEKEKEKLRELNILLEDWSKIIKNSKEFKKLKYERLEKFLKSISDLENKLKDFYEKHSEIIKELSKVSEEDSKQKEEKMNILVKIQELSSQKKVWEELNEKLFKRGKEALEAVINAIEKGDKEQRSSSENNSGGGGIQQTEGEKAKKTLDDVKSQFSSLNEKIKEILAEGQGHSKILEMLTKEGGPFKSQLSKLESNINSFSKLFEMLKSSGTALHQNSNRVIDRLNSLRIDLQKVNKEWEELKDFLLELTNYEGKIKNSICRNSENNEKQKCELNSETNLKGLTK